MIFVCLALLCLSLQVLAAGNPAIITTPGTADGFGTSVSVFGQLVAIGAPATNNGVGAVYLYLCANDASGCTLQADIGPFSSSPGQAYGASVSLNGLSQNQIYLSVGAPGATQGGQGSVYFYQIQGTSLTSIANLTESGNTNFGAQVVSAVYPPSQVFLYASSPLASTVYFFNCTLQVTCAFGVQTTQALTNNTLSVTDGFGSSLTALAYGAFIGAPGRNSNAGSVFIFYPDPKTGAFVQLDEAANPTAYPIGFGASIALDYNLLQGQVGVYIGSYGGLVASLTCPLSTLECVPGTPLNQSPSTQFGASLAAGNGYLFVGAYNATHATTNDGEIFSYSNYGATVGTTLVATSSKYLGKVLSASSNSNLVVAGSNTAVATPIVYVYSASSTVIPTSAPTSAPTSTPTSAPTTHSGAAANVASFLLVALLLACQLLF